MELVTSGRRPGGRTEAELVTSSGNLLEAGDEGESPPEDHLMGTGSRSWHDRQYRTRWVWWYRCDIEYQSLWVASQCFQQGSLTFIKFLL